MAALGSKRTVARSRCCLDTLSLPLQNATSSDCKLELHWYDGTDSERWILSIETFELLGMPGFWHEC